MGARVLVVEDNPQAVALIEAALQGAGHSLLVTDEAGQALRLFERESFELAVLDIKLREGTGYDVCRGIRGHASKGALPVVMLTGETALESKSAGFAAGADIYLTKPIQTAELILWVDALLRRSRQDWSAAALIEAGDLSINPQTRAVHVRGELVRDMTDKEFRLLLELAKARPRVVTRERLVERLWDGNRASNTVEVHVNRLRSRLGPYGASHVVTQKGVGYRLE